MIDFISGKIADFAIEKGIIKKDEYELYHFAYLTLFYRIISWGSILLIGIFTSCFIGTVSFLATFIPLRVYAGGFHASGYFKCFTSSTLSFITMVVVYKFFYNFIPLYAVLAVLAFCAVILFLLSPLEDENKPLDANETVKYRKRARLILVIELSILLLLLHLDATKQFAAFMFMAIVFETTLMIAGFIKNSHRKKVCQADLKDF